MMETRHSQAGQREAVALIYCGTVDVLGVSFEQAVPRKVKHFLPGLGSVLWG